MLKHRVIPVLLYRDGMVVKGKKFKDHRTVGPLVPAVKVHEMRNVDELILLDIGKPEEAPDYEIIAEACENCFMPVTVGGGVSRISHIRNLLNNGADKVCIKTHTELIYDAVKKFGSQSIVACLDIWDRQAIDIKSRALDLTDYKGAGELIIQAAYLDGTMEGYDYDLIAEVSEAVSVPVIALGGAGKPEEFTVAFQAGASAAAAGSLFIWTQTTPRHVALELFENGFQARI